MLLLIVLVLGKKWQVTHVVKSLDSFYNSTLTVAIIIK